MDVKTEISEIESALNHLYSLARPSKGRVAYESFRKAMEALKELESKLAGGLIL